ncbi:Translation machinery-associated protein 22, partial [Ascosphaera pollenicola]
MAFVGAYGATTRGGVNYSSRKPYSAVTVQIENLTSEAYEVDDSTGIIDLIEAIRIQSSGPTEAARALRKKLKYGDVHRQLRALTLLDLLIQNAGSHFTSNFADEPLLERLRIAGSDITSDPQVRQKCKVLFAQWSTLKHQPGMGRVGALYAQLPRKQKTTQDRKRQSKVLRETEYHPEQNQPHTFGHQVSVSGGNAPNTVVGSRTFINPDGGASAGSHHGGFSFKSSKKDKDKKHKSSPSSSSHPTSPTHSRTSSLTSASVRETLANARISADGLMNALRLVNRERESVSENPDVVRRFSECRAYRRQILKYIHGISDEDYLGSLLAANEELVMALMSYEVMERGVDDDDSDSEVEGEKWRPYDEEEIDS